MIATTATVVRVCFISVPKRLRRAVDLHPGHTGHRVTDSRSVGHYDAQVDRTIVVGLSVDHLLVEDQSQAGGAHSQDVRNTFSNALGCIHGVSCNFLPGSENFLGDHDVFSGSGVGECGS